MSTIELIDKMDGFKRFMLVIPIELAFVGIVLIMAWQGKTIEALAAAAGIFGTMVGYYFGKNDVIKTG